MKGLYVVSLPALKTAARRTVVITKDLYDKLKLKTSRGRLYPELTDVHTLEVRMCSAFDKHLKGFDPRGPVRSHNFRASKATHMVQKGI